MCSSASFQYVGIGIGVYSAHNTIIMNKSRHSHQKVTHSKKGWGILKKGNTLDTLQILMLMGSQMRRHWKVIQHTTRLIKSRRSRHQNQKHLLHRLNYLTHALMWRTFSKNSQLVFCSFMQRCQIYGAFHRFWAEGAYVKVINVRETHVHSAKVLWWEFPELCTCSASHPPSVSFGNRKKQFFANAQIFFSKSTGNPLLWKIECEWSC